MKTPNEKLMDAIAVNDLKAAKAAIGAGANVNEIAYFDETPLIVACRSHAIDPDIVALLLDCGAHPNHREYSGFTPLLLAVMRRSTEIVGLLIKAGADPYLTLHNKNIIWYALQSPNAEMVPFLDKCGVDLDMIDPESGYSALDWAHYHKMPHYIHRLTAAHHGATPHTTH